MLRLDDGGIVLAASDLTDFLACGHLTQQRLAIARGERGRPRPVDDPHADLIRMRGERHEVEQLARLSAECGGHTDLSTALPHSWEALEAAADATLRAMRTRAPLIYQAQFFNGRWQGRVDFLQRIDVPSRLGDYSYEIIDTKLARQVKPVAVHQLAVYNRLLAEIQGVEPELAHLILGDGSLATLHLSRYAALHRRVVQRLEKTVETPAVATYPEPVAHCAICALQAECRERLVGDDHLSLVANIRRDQRKRLGEMQIGTVAKLGRASEQPEPRRLDPGRFATLHGQAELQVESRERHEPVHRHLDPVRAGGYARLPVPSPGDVFFDLEGDPYIGDGGIEYLWGWWSESERYECLWAHDAHAEKAAFERFVDRIGELRRRNPDLHVYHYAPHERSKLRSLSIQYSTREDEIDELLRGEVLVDLLAVVRQGMQVGEESYSLKRLERHHGFERLEHSIREGGGSIVAYEQWLESGDDGLLEAIRAYNEEDCRSTLSLRNWLVDRMRPEAEQEFGVDFDELREPEPEEEHGPPEWLAEVEALAGRLTDGLGASPEDDGPDEAERRLLAHLMLYHRREGKPAWWRYFDLRGTAPADLIDERDALAGLYRDQSFPPTPFKKSLDYTFRFPGQEFRLKPGRAEDPTTDEGHNVVEVADDHIVVRRAAASPAPEPVALIEGKPIDVKVLRQAVMSVVASLLADDGRFSAARALLKREPPRLRSGTLGESTDELIAAALGLDNSILPVQGPPGTGKTFRGARMVVAALRAGLRVGITAQSHAAIMNFLGKIEEHAGPDAKFSAIYKGEDYVSQHDLVECTGDNADVTPDHQLVAGTAWLFSRPEHREQFDLVFVDEAGQFALANTVAVATATASVVLLGDPQQLPQVTQTDHPDGSGASVLEHILGGARTIAPDRGVLLTETWRMHPEICEFVSERSYDGRLRSREACDLRRVQAERGVLSGTGLRVLHVAHDGRSQASPEEAHAIAKACRDLLAGATVTDDKGIRRKMKAKDILVVAPYNLAVHCIRGRVPDGVNVGTVDRFQGRQAPVVFYAMTCSSGEEVPRGLDFLFDDHRLNVAVSRAECLAVLVHSPRLLDADCPTLAAMQLVDGVCRFAELATPLAPPDTRGPVPA